MKALFHRFLRWHREPFDYSVDPETLQEHTCANCGTVFKGNYCPVCQQSAGDGRITWKWVYQCIMTVWGLDTRSLPRTLWHLVIHPGRLIDAYINGHRQVSYTPFNMLFLVALLYAILKQLLGLKANVITDAELVDYEVFLNVYHWMLAHPAWAMMSMTTIITLPTWILFRFSPRNPHHTLTESLFIQIFMSTLMIIISFSTYLSDGVTSLLIPLYYYYCYHQFFGYGPWGTCWRIILLLFLWILTIIMLAAAVISIETLVEQDQSIWFIGGAMTVFALFFIIVAGLILTIGYRISRRAANRRTLANEK